MAASTTTTTRWSDEEKIATLLAIIKANGSTPNWKETKIPAGRTMQSTQKMYEGLKKQAASVEMVGADKQTPSKIMGPRKSPIKKRSAPSTTNGKRSKAASSSSGKKALGGGEAENGATTGGLTDDEDGDEQEGNDKKRVKREDSGGDNIFGDGIAAASWGFSGTV